MAYRIPNFDIRDNAPLCERIAMKRAHIAHYEGVLSRSLGSRWYDMGRRNLARLRLELEDLLDQAGSSAIDSPTPEPKS